MAILEALTAGLVLVSGVNDAAIKRAYPDSCPPDPVLPAILPDVPHYEVIGNASALFAWQLVSITGMGTPYKGHPCSDGDGDGFDLTCIVPDMLNPDRQSEYNDKLTHFGLAPDVVHAIVEQRAGCAANLDTFVAKEHIKTHFNALVTSLSSPVLVKSTLAVAASEFFAWQLGGIVRDLQFVEHACNKNLAHLKSGLDLVAMDVTSFTVVFCGKFLTNGLPTASDVAAKSQNLMTALVGTTG